MRHLSALVRPTFIAGLMAVLAASTARAQAPATVIEKAPTAPRSFSLTISPLHLVLPIVELTGEVRLSDKMGVAGILGAGTLKSDSTFSSEESKFSAFELGAQFRYYAFGTFRHGMQLGVEAVYLRISGNIGSASGRSEGLAFGPFVGYKIITSAGFTFDGQLGVQRMGIASQAHDSTSSASGSDSSYLPLLNLNVGWSF